MSWRTRIASVLLRYRRRGPDVRWAEDSARLWRRWDGLSDARRSAWLWSCRSRGFDTPRPWRQWERWLHDGCPAQDRGGV